MYDKFTLVRLPANVWLAIVGLGFLAVVAWGVNAGIEAAKLGVLG